MTGLRNEVLFIDGYNIINSWDELKIQSEISLESAREKLIDIIANYQGFTEIETIIVFDGYNVKRSTENKMKYKTISVVFTKEGQTADNYIEKAVSLIPKETKIRVATSDYLEQIMVMGRGATRVSARELHDEIFDTENKIRKNYIENRPPKKNMLADNLDEETRTWLENMRLGKK
ncbi:MAG: NYN domain-containing protein [Firmicutes bacterium]|nr:NYN domain-containing protein [Bacillota bacterium]MBQ7241791.1 NYN domain-containing protein [Bacillota bacterium]MBR0104023.1 NYN domain-containing protein [Bacillota bacterium]